MLKPQRAVLAILMLSTLTLSPQVSSPVISIEIHADHAVGRFAAVWNFFGYDEPNYTYASNGKKLVGELAKLGSEPAQIRAHNILTTGNGVAAFKWGSTNAYTEDASGKPITGAQVTVTFYMPAMPAMGMAAMKTTATLTDKGNGLYEGTGELGSGGTWQVTITVQKNGQTLASKQMNVSATGGM